MKTYDVTITANLQKAIKVKATSKREAIEIAIDKYENGDINLFDLSDDLNPAFKATLSCNQPPHPKGCGFLNQDDKKNIVKGEK